MRLTLVVVVAGLVGSGWYVGHCAWWPFAACRRCKGQGNFRSGSGRSWRRCRRCRGSGERLRIGRRVWNYFADRRREASRG